MSRAKLKKHIKDAKRGDLYNALHRVGDDNTKVQIEDLLEQMLDDESFYIVLGIFRYCVSED